MSQHTTITGVRVITERPEKDWQNIRRALLRQFPRARLYIGTPAETGPAVSVSGTVDGDLEAALAVATEIAGR